MSSPSLVVVVGENCRRIRKAAGVTQDDLARCARQVGLRWNAAKVGNFEAARSAPTISTVFAVVLALQMAVRDSRNVTLADLLAGDGFVALTDSIDISASVLAGVCRGQAFRLQPDMWHPKIRHTTREDVNALIRGDVATLLARSGLAEQRLAHRLGISRARLAATSFRLWQSTFSEERDRRAGPHGNQQKRGQVSRALRAELEKALADGND